MAGKDFGLYREAGGGASLTNTWADLTFDTNVQQDSGFSRSGGTVTQADAGAILALFGTGVEENGGGSACVRLDLQQDTGSGFGGIKGGRAYTSFNEADGVDGGQAFGATVIDGGASDDYKLRARTQISGETADESADLTSLQLLQFPADFDVCILSESSNDSNIASGFDYLTWDTTERIDSASFATASNGGIEVQTAGRYLLVANVCFELDDVPSGAAEGVMYHVVATLNATVAGAAIGERIDHTFRRKTAPHFATPSTAANVVILRYLDLSANDVVRLHRRYRNKGTGTDQVDVLGAQSVFAMVRIDDSTPSHGAIALRRASDATGWTGSQIIDWDTLVANDGSSFTHSTSTNPSRVTYPTGKTLTLLGLGLNRGTGVDSTSAWTGQMKRSGSTLHSYGVGGSGINLGDPSTEPAQNQSDMALGFLYDASGDYFEVQTDEVGTAADSASTLRGGVDGWASLFQAIDIESWPDDATNQEIALGAASGVASAAALTTGLGALGVSLGAANSEGAGASVSADPGALGVSLSPASSVASASAVSVSPGALGVSLEAAASASAGVSPSIFSGMTIALGAASSVAVGRPPSVGFGALAVSVGPAASSGLASSLTVTLPGEGDFYRDASNAVRARWKAQIEDVVGLSTQYDNLPFQAPYDTLYARVSVAFDDAQVESVGGTGALTVALGEMLVSLFQPIMLGSKAALDTADLVLSEFREVRDTASVGDDVVRFFSPRITRRSQAGAHYVVEIRCPFRAEQTAALVPHTTPLLGLDEQEVGEALRSLWAAQVEAVVPLPTQYDALPFTRPAASQWARVTILDGEPVPAAEPGLARSVGVFMAQVFTPAEVGERGGLEAVDTINRAFRHREVQGLRTGAPRVSAGVRSGPWWQHTISIPWQADQFT